MVASFYTYFMPVLTNYIRVMLMLFTITLHGRTLVLSLTKSSPHSCLGGLAIYVRVTAEEVRLYRGHVYTNHELKCSIVLIQNLYLSCLVPRLTILAC